jgi:glycine/D-amino acid oxidase-like deaminating enzyme
LTTAYYLAKSGGRVVVLDKGDCGQEASWAGAGILPPSSLAHAKTRFALDLDCWESRRQCAIRHDVLRSDGVSRVIEVQEVTGGHVHGADAEARLAGIDAIEVDQAFECGPERRRIVVACGLDARWPASVGTRGAKKPAAPPSRAAPALS